MPFFRIYKESENLELILNSDLISKIIVKYVTVSVNEAEKTRTLWRTSLRDAQENLEAIRCYEVHVAGEVINLESNPDDAVVKLIETIYNESIKA